MAHAANVPARIRTVCTAELSGSDLRAVRQLLDEAYAGDFSDDDWDHTLGGMHTLVYADAEIVGHVAVVRRQLLHERRSIRTGYVEALAVRCDARRRGYARLAMAEAERIITAGYDLGALSDGTDIPGFYEHRGWRVWRGPTQVLTPHGPMPTPEEDGSVLVLVTPGTPSLDLDGPLACDWRSGDAW